METGLFVRERFRGFITAAVGFLALFAMGAVLRAQSINMQYVTVGNPGNAADPATGVYTDSGYEHFGSVGYTYNIGEYDVTDSQYCTFLNAVDPTGANALYLYSPLADAEFGISVNQAAVSGSKYSVIPGYANMPVVDVDYWDTLRFANYLDDGNTEAGAYTLIGGSTDEFGTPSNASSLLTNPQPNAGASVWLPSENEWYKAAYYNPANGTYSTYATQNNTAPGNIIGSGTNEANYYTGNAYSVTQSSSDDSSQNYLTAVGSFSGSPSYYGTFDQSGDVFNCNSTIVSANAPVLHGGFWNSPSFALSSTARYYFSQNYQGNAFGFRVASVPEPTSMVLMLAGVAGLGLMRGKCSKL